MPLPLLEHTGRLIPAFERRHYTLGFGGAAYPAGGPRDELFAAYAHRLRDTFGLFDMPLREAWAEAAEIVEGAGARWAYLRSGADSYQERAAEDTDPVPGTTFWSASGTC